MICTVQRGSCQLSVIRNPSSVSIPVVNSVIPFLGSRVPEQRLKTSSSDFAVDSGQLLQT